jgi:hypothetical protein
MVMAMEGEGGEYGLGNAVILAQPKAQFLNRWYDLYHSFRGAPGVYWSEHSIELPGRLAKEFPQDIHVLPSTAFFRFMWNDAELKLLYETIQEVALDSSYATHLWETFAWEYLDHLTPGQLRAKDTNFSRLALPYLTGIKDNLGERTLAEKAVRLAKIAKRRLLR